MNLSRRKTLAILGGGLIVAAGGFGHAITRQPQTAMLPWSMAGQYDDPRMRALSHAVLAPNPHNRQPWLVDLRREGEVTLLVDHDRLLPHTDPFNRQIVVGLGCFLELMVLAAGQEGYGVDLTLFPDGEDAQALTNGRIAVARFIPGAATPEPALAEQILNRRSNKAPYDMSRPVDDATLARLTASAARGGRFGATNDPERVQALRDLSVAAIGVEFDTPRTYHESVHLFRIGHAEIDANPDGLEMGGPMFEALRIFGIFTREKSMPLDSFAATSGRQTLTDEMRTAMAHVWLVTEGNSRADQIAAGRDWVRMNLVATALGVGLHPLSQALQEYPEMAAHYAEAHRLMAPGGGTVQMFGRLGYAPESAPTPRWPLETRVLNA